MNKVTLFLSLIALLLSAHSLPGQSSLTVDDEDPPLRIEIPVRSTNETYRVLSLGSNGMIICYRSVEMASADEVNWYFSLYDSNFIQQWTVPVPVPVEHTIAETMHCQDSVVLLLAPSGKSRSDDRRVEFIFVSPGKESVRITRDETDPGAEYSSLIRDGRKLIVSADFSSAPAKIYQFDFDSGKTIRFPVAQAGDISIITILPELSANRIYAVVCKKLSRKESVCFFITFDTTGKLLGEFPISLPEDTQLTHGQILGQGQDTFLLLGCYGPITGGNIKETEKKQLTTGFIAVPILYGKPQNSKVLNFLELSSSNQFLAEKDILALKKKALKKNKPITEYSVDFHVLMHDVRVIDKTCLIVLEVFNPQYHSETFTDFDFYGRPYTNSYSVFDGYRFSNAIVAGFGPGGELLWDNSISFRNILSMDLTPKLVLHPAANSEYVLLYLTEGMIASKIIQQSSTVEKTSFSPLDLRFPDDKLLSESRAAVQHWYRDYFLSYGYQEIKNLSGKMTGKRMVYSVTKLKFVR